MEPLTLLAWVGIIALSLVISAITIIIVWSVVQTMRGKSVTNAKPSITLSAGDAVTATAITKVLRDAVRSGHLPNGGL